MSYKTTETAWCPGCGDNFIIESLKNTLEELKIPPYKVLLMGGIGQAAKTPQYLNANSFCGLHGRALPAAIGAKIANKELTVIINTGDGDSYGEGGNHFLHNIRRNADITHFVHNNQIYGLTKGQASPTTDMGHKTSVQPEGNANLPLNPLLLAIVTGAGFVARGFSGDTEQLKFLMKQAIIHRGYSLVDILQPCVSFNKVNTFQWYSKRVYKLEENYNPSDKKAAIEKAMEWGDKIPTGILYSEEKSTFHDMHPLLCKDTPLYKLSPDLEKVGRYLEEFT